jgi:hypothetical protein
LLHLIRSTRLVGTPYLLAPGTPKELVQTLREAMKTFQDPEFRKEFHKLTGDDPNPLMPEASSGPSRETPRPSNSSN